MKILEKVADVQFKYSVWVLIFALALTLFLGARITNISMQSDMNQMMPQDLEIYKLANKIEDNFGGQDASIVLLKIDDSETDGIYDIRDPQVIEFLVSLDEALSDEELIESTQSVGMMFSEDTIPETLDESRAFFSNVPGASSFFNKDYSATIMMISSDLGGGEDKIKELEEIINDAVFENSRPSGLKVYVTGSPQIRSIILDLLASDAVYTLSISAIIILLLLIVLEKSFTKAFLVFVPLLLGIVWTLGTMGWLGIELSIATVGLGAMILGLGVEYGVFIVSRYCEERKEKGAQDALRIAVSNVGGSVLGSGTTTVMGFLALTLSMMPVLRDLGLSLAIGISFSLMAAVLVNPSLIILEERLEHWLTERRHKVILEKRDKHKSRRNLDEKNN